MTTWQQFSDEAPALSESIAARLRVHKHHVLATLRADGSPRVSGTEVEIFRGLLVLGSMPGAMKVRDLHRDPRFSLHSNPGHHTMEGGDAKISGRARELFGDEKQAILESYDQNPGDEAQIFELGVEEAVLTTVSEDRLHVDLWRPGAGVTRRSR
ncbi:pyridoxamine 5'-phosphate oxidase family protein [Rhodococcus maanshanensis]|uniref:pyridoxamine 5'-phosphate oxidase family protein n=1 Tax=Rhodococcus maanshanensis TaxID=183556 RepID=UPI0022B45085|nr:pyridoxamine 5'-phosphate oxidase family protein [Rhodococcus maanshanensis]MCZ4554935.1 pyridoxamine 5'-phosphate oxidase family protein [Rhodococcus maanshanensis]